MKFGAPLPAELQLRFRWQQIADMRPGWSMDYIKGMTEIEVIDFYAYMDTKNDLEREARNKRK